MALGRHNVPRIDHYRQSTYESRAYRTPNATGVAAHPPERVRRLSLVARALRSRPRASPRRLPWSARRTATPRAAGVLHGFRHHARGADWLAGANHAHPV